MDLIFSVALLLGSLYLFFLVGAESPAPTPTELGAAFWPRIILALLMILLVVNILNVLKASKAEGKSPVADIDVAGFFKSKLIVGIAIVLAFAFVLPYIGFIPGCFLFLIAYGYLLGDRNIVMSIIRSLVITLVIYVLFQGALDIMLARGVGPFRDFALFFEMALPF